MYGGGYGSEFDDGSVGHKRKHDSINYRKNDVRNYHASGLPSKSQVVDNYDREQQRLDFAKFNSLDAYDRHRLLIHDYIKYYGGKIEDFARKKEFKTDFDVIQENHRFVWDDEGDENEKTWGQKLAKKYYDKLFKEYCISDLSRYKQKQFAMRWRTESEVQSGKGQFSCGARKCDEKKGLKTWEVNFVYLELSEKKNTLIKLRLCPDCSYMLNYHKKHKQIKKKNKMKKQKKSKKKKKRKKHKKDHDNCSSSSDDSEDNDDSESDNNESVTKDNEDTSSSKSTSKDSVWKQTVEEPTEKSKDELFDDYLEDLFL